MSHFLQKKQTLRFIQSYTTYYKIYMYYNIGGMEKGVYGCQTRGSGEKLT